MRAQCCARRASGVAASVLPAALLALLPKCPLCLAAWLTVATGVSFSEAGAAWLRGTIVVFWIAALALFSVGAVYDRPYFVDSRKNGRS